MMLIALFSLLLITLADSRFPTPISRNSLSHQRNGVFKTCHYRRQFGGIDMKIQICREVWQYSQTKPPIETCTIHLDQASVDKLKEGLGGILQPKKLNDAARNNHDGDMCCPTVKRATKADSKMVNSFGKLRDVVRIAEYDLYQYYPQGTCLGSSELVHCKGKCVQEMGTIYLMVMRDDLPMGISFEPFEIPTYCSCKNLGETPTRPQTVLRSSKAPVITKNETTKATTHNPTSTDFQRPTPPPPRRFKPTSPQTTINNKIRSRLDKIRMLPTQMKYSRIVAASALSPSRRPPVPRVIPVGYRSTTTETPVPDTTNVSQSVIEPTEINNQNITLSETDYNITMSGTNSSLAL